MKWGWVPTTPRGRIGGVWKHKGEWWPTGRRLIPVARVSELWKEGKTVSQICNLLGPIKGTKLTPGAVQRAIYAARQRDPSLFPIRRSADDGEFDPGIDTQTQRRLGL